MAATDPVHFVATAPRLWVPATLGIGVVSAVYGGRALTSATAPSLGPWLALWLGLGAALIGAVGVFRSRRPHLSVSLETGGMRWRDARGETRLSYLDIEAIAFSRGKHVPSAFYMSTRDGRRLEIDCTQLTKSNFDNMRWELAARTGLEVKRVATL